MIPRCKECQHCELRNRAESKFTGGYGYGRGYFFCENQETKRLPREAFGNQMPSFIGFGTPEYETKLTVKTSPRCAYMGGLQFGNSYHRAGARKP